MKKTSLVLAVVLGLFMLLTINAGTAFATNWIKIPFNSSDGTQVYVDADSAVKQGGHLIYWTLIAYANDRGSYRNGRRVAKIANKCEVDLRTPHKSRSILNIYWDSGDNQLGEPYIINDDWFNGDPRGFDIVLPYAKEGRDTGAIPAPTSDH
jgi:hypothetical protein